MTTPVSQDWLDMLVEQVNQQRPDGELIVSSGHSPSGTYHIGTMREIMTANAITWALKRAGRDARHLDFVDDFDALRKIPSTVPTEWSKYLGQPLAIVPDPFDCHPSYGAHFLAQLHVGLEGLGSMPDETISGYRNYKDGVLVEQLELSLNQLPQIRQILTEVGGRQLDEHWAPVQIIDSDYNLRTLKYAGWDPVRRMVTWKNKVGETGEVSLESGQVKLDWRLDWPARWKKWGVSVEPFGRDHATKGGSYDTGRVLVDRIFSGEAPYPVPYEFINPAGDTKKMSKSSGNVLTPLDALAVMPAEILRYFVIGPRPSRTLIFDSGLGLYRLVDDYSKVAADQATAAVLYAKANAEAETVARIPFNHLVAVYQTAQGDTAQARDILERTGYASAVAAEWPVIEREFGFVHTWLDKYAPDSVKFRVQAQLPNVELSDAQKVFLAKLARTLRQETDLSGQGMHDAIYAASQEAEVKPGQAFVALYRVILGQDSGPKAGWFLASLNHDWLVERLTLAQAD